MSYDAVGGVFAERVRHSLDADSVRLATSDSRLMASHHVSHLAIATSRSARGVRQRPLRRSGRAAGRRVAPRVSAGQATGAATWRGRWSSGPAIASPGATRRPAGRICRPPIGSAARAKRSASCASNMPTATLDEVRRYLAAGQPAPALARLEKLHRKGSSDEPVAGCCQQIASSCTRPTSRPHAAILPRQPPPSTGPQRWRPSVSLRSRVQWTNCPAA